ncbi:MAG: hypothetical protein IJO68_00360 [Clostridia bacterium]|nr:hypothetical protein [Clostridia bacterium]
MKRKIIGNVEPRCEYCKHGKLSADNESILCPKQGVLSKDFSCKKFSYDALKRVPQKSSPALQQFSPEDFEL